VFIVFIVLRTTLDFFAKKQDASFEQQKLALLIFDLTYMIGLALILTPFSGVCQ
jgi:hypothetical protein